jgi:STE24 endopeptidase
MNNGFYMAETTFYLIVAFVIFDFVAERVLAYLNATRFSEALPDELAWNL